MVSSCSRHFTKIRSADFLAWRCQKDHGGSHTKFTWSRPHSSHGDSPSKQLGEYFGGSRPETEEERDRRVWEKEKKRRRKAKEKKKAQEVFITMHVSQGTAGPLVTRRNVESLNRPFYRSPPFWNVSISS